MNREIKFRAWDKSTREMLTAELFNPIYWEDLSILDYIIMGAKQPDHDYHGRDAYELMQYTGLKDKDGVEIYEGDVLWHATRHYAVTFHDGAFWLGGYQMRDWRHSEVEVVGNIHENPELLTEARS